MSHFLFFLALLSQLCYDKSCPGKQVEILRESVAVWRRNASILTRGPRPGDRPLAKAEKAG